MADLVLSPALQVIFDRLASPLLQSFANMWDFKDNLKSLQHALKLVQATLEDAEEQQLTNKAIRLWLSNLKNAARDTEDFLDFYASNDAIPMGAYVPRRLEFPNWKHIGRDKVKAMLKALETTAIEGLLMFNFKKNAMENRPSNKRETSSFVVESEIHGRQDDKDKLIKLLLSSEASQKGYATCIPLIGIGGIGKTTLAQLTYNDDRVIQHFDVRVWIFVSDNFNVQKIFKTTIEYVTEDECKFSEIDQLQSRLWRLLHNKRYLIVLDDVWTEDPEDWDKLRPLFRKGVDGCKIIVTTRSKKIPLIMDFPNSPYYLSGLTADDCWTLFKQRAFGQGEEEKYRNLRWIGKQIVNKCGGMPLAVKSLGSVMRFKREHAQWLFVRNSEFWKLDVCQHKVLPALMLSYLHLPSHLKQCFAFCSIFPKNYEFKKQKLIHLWMAEGLILQEGSKRPEDIGDEYFADLLWISFFQEVEVCDVGSISRYKMNDVIHDLARHVAGQDSTILEHGFPPSSSTQTRHTSVVYTYGAITIPESLYEAEHLRTLLLIGESGFLENGKKLFSSFEYLRVLDLYRSDVSDLPEALGSLRCLRYLDLSYAPISKLPESMSYLFFLQTLNLSGCCNLKSLPPLYHITSLRHLDITGCQSLTEMPYGIKNSRQLQTLPLFVVSRDFLGMGLPNPWADKSLAVLNHLNLYGELKITHLENVSNVRGAHSAGLISKENLESLGLYWGSYRGFELDKLDKPQPEVGVSRSHLWPGQVPLDAGEVERILQGLQPHNNLKKLVIDGYPGIRFPHLALPNINVVNLACCRNCEQLPALGNLVLLKNLSLHGMDGVRCIGPEFYGDSTDIRFSSLEELSLSDFPNLEEWSSANDGNAFPRLKKLIVKRCPKLGCVPLSQSLQHLELRDCNPTLMSIANLTNLSVLVIEKLPGLFSLPEGLSALAPLSSLKILSCPKLRSLPLEMGNLTALKSLTIRWCEELLMLPDSLQNLKALESLEIGDCYGLLSMPDAGIGGLSSLRTLSIENCSNLTSFSSTLEHLAFLEHLTIMYCPSLGSFPEGVQCLSALRSLTILSCPWFDSLPDGLQNVRTLNCLEISSCPNLTSLPEWFGDLDSLRSLTISDCPNLELLPPGLKLLTKLQHLSIQECPELVERCRPESGEDWFKIAHVPHKYIGSPPVGRSSEASTSGGSSSQASAQ